ncbi:MAG TPA: holo-ACP synthase [Kofleriaceae bacterium]|jgi:holo-[acyl-carrier protein] synthase
MRFSVGIDLVHVSRIAASVEAFGERFLRRVYTDAEVAYATSSPGLAAERLAARFAAKEAAKKALRLDGVSWRDLEVRRADSGACDLVLHGAALASAGACSTALSMSHDGDCATAVVISYE